MASNWGCQTYTRNREDSKHDEARAHRQMRVARHKQPQVAWEQPCVRTRHAYVQVGCMLVHQPPTRLERTGKV
eukprot:6200356-Pleurochrysis_carterae.AAC.2